MTKFDFLEKSRSEYVVIGAWAVETGSDKSTRMPNWLVSACSAYRGVISTISLLIKLAKHAYKQDKSCKHM